MAKIVTLKDIPKRGKRKWREIFERVPKGKVLALEDEDFNSLYSGLNYFKSKGEFLDYSVIYRKNEEGKTIVYIIRDGIKRKGVKEDESTKKEAS